MATGADVTVIPAKDYSAEAIGTLYVGAEKLVGVGKRMIKSLRKVDTQIKWNDRATHEIIFVVEGVRDPLLGRPAIQALNVLSCLHEISTTDVSNQDISREYAPLLQGRLGKIKTQYEIALHPDARPSPSRTLVESPFHFCLLYTRKSKVWRILG